MLTSHVTFPSLSSFLRDIRCENIINIGNNSYSRYQILTLQNNRLENLAGCPECQVMNWQLNLTSIIVYPIHFLLYFPKLQPENYREKILSAEVGGHKITDLKHYEARLNFMELVVDVLPRYGKHQFLARVMTNNYSLNEFSFIRNNSYSCN